jgi:hypothetical protein
MINIRIIFFLLAGTLFFFLLLRFQGKLETKFSPASIVSLELAHDAASVKDITTIWYQEGMTSRAKTNIWIDFLFIPFYAMLFYTLCGSISVRMNGIPAKLGVLLAFGSLVAGLLDVLENMLMLFALNGHFNNFFAFLTTVFATVKFSLLLLAIVYILPLGLRLLLLRKINISSQSPVSSRQKQP